MPQSFDKFDNTTTMMLMTCIIPTSNWSNRKKPHISVALHKENSNRLKMMDRLETSFSREAHQRSVESLALSAMVALQSEKMQAQKSEQTVQLGIYVLLS